MSLTPSNTPDNESNYWQSLEYRVSAELAGDDSLHRWWCDGLSPSSYQLDGETPHVNGVAWLGESGQEKWTFEQRLPDTTSDRDQIDWSALLPADDVTGWLSVDVQRRHVVIDPAEAVPDDVPR